MSTTVIRIGDRVTWRSGKSEPERKSLPLGITGCKVLTLFDNVDKRACAQLDCGAFGEAFAYVDDLEPEGSDDDIGGHLGRGNDGAAND